MNFYSQETLPPVAALINNLKMGWQDGKIEREKRMAEMHCGGNTTRRAQRRAESSSHVNKRGRGTRWGLRDRAS